MRESLGAILDAFVAKGIVGASAAVLPRGGAPVLVASGLADRERSEAEPLRRPEAREHRAIDVARGGHE